MSKLLICEGHCNGGMVQELDAKIREYGRVRVEGRHGYEVETSAAPHWVLEQIRNLIYTLHRRIGTDLKGYDRHACEICGFPRRY